MIDVLLAHDEIIHGFASLSEAVGWVLMGLTLGTVVGAAAGLLRKWRR